MAHLLWKYDGLCKNIHGHSYILYVTVLGDIINNPDDPKLGMVIDFGDLKRIVKEEIVDVLDHAIAVNDNSPHVHLDQYTERIIRLPYQPTCENMVVDFADRAELDQWLKVEPYVTGDVWRKIEVAPCRVAPMFMAK